MDRFAIVNLPIPKFETSLGNLGLEVIVLSRNTPYFVESVEISNQTWIYMSKCSVCNLKRITLNILLQRKNQLVSKSVHQQEEATQKSNNLLY